MSSVSPNYDDNDGPVKKGRYPQPAICEGCPCDVYPLLVLLCICFLTFGSYWVFDIPGSISKSLQQWFGPSYTTADNNLLYSVYSWPNTVLAFFGGFLTDWMGVRMGAFLFCSLVMLGQLIFSIGVQSKTFWLCVAGRFVFGLGGESLTVAQNTFAVRWFDGPRLAMVFGLVVAFSRIGSSINFAVTPVFANLGEDGVPLALWIGSACTILSFTACCCLCALDWFATGKARVKEVSADDAISLAHVKDFPGSSWMLFAICVFLYVPILSFYSVATSIMEYAGKIGNFSDFTYTENQASLFLFIPNCVSIACSPLFGMMVDRFGKAIVCLFVSSTMITIFHILFLIDVQNIVFIHPVILFLWLGTAYSLGASALWPMLKFIIPARSVGTAYGLMTAIQNLGLAIAPLMTGLLLPANYTDCDPPVSHCSGTMSQLTHGSMFFIGSAGFAMVLSLLLVTLDKKLTGGRLMMSAAQLKADNEAKAALDTTPLTQALDPIV
eukprot:gnl/Hemi2/9139_TR3176_c1_g1_i1.p1 gnl/Hemi2/9139_TR3176_c1_g1~~gnl/Hemi2/9139_TR3176_c1_g1_i1.p1  ORF type:complete len:496 (-),score=189.90 gnl/Hemi2/9139_TR3176_c1_g1_i1:279-1766(-)